MVADQLLVRVVVSGKPCLLKVSAKAVMAIIRQAFVQVLNIEGLMPNYISCACLVVFTHNFENFCITTMLAFRQVVIELLIAFVFQWLQGCCPLTSKKGTGTEQ